jgi:diguanylate cyclase (GGDEF)-like protein
MARKRLFAPFRRRALHAWDDARLLHLSSRLIDVARRSASEVVEALAEAIASQDAKADTLAILMVRGDELRCEHLLGPRVQAREHLRMRCDDPVSLAARALYAQRCMNYPSDGRALLAFDRSALAVPWVDREAARGVVYLSSFVSNARLASHAPALAAAQMPFLIACEREAGRIEADVDETTGLLTLRAFRRRLEDEIRQASSRRPSASMCLWFVDADGFKDVNDRLGHRAGDGVLRTLASLLRAQAVDGLDIAARTGGDEFCLLTRATGKARAIERALNLCAAVNRHAFALAGVTASIGVAAYPHDAVTPGDLLDAADRAMYYSKHTGRNRVSYQLEPDRWASVLPEAAVPNPRTSCRWDERSVESFSERSSR